MLSINEFAQHIESIADIRNLDDLNPVEVRLGHPVTGMSFIVIASVREPKSLLIPINGIWVCCDPNSGNYRKVFRLVSFSPSTDFNATWAEETLVPPIFEYPQSYSLPRGDPGPTGPTGPIGVPGPVGPKGDVGVTGPVGPAGTQGPTGPIGPQGVRGLVGPTGPAGPTGLTGPTGPASTVPGPAGPTGPAGSVGPRGDPGIQGLVGPTGPAGLTGPAGPTGSPGTPGVQGIQGIAGPTGSPADLWLTVPSGMAVSASPFLANQIYGFDAYNSPDMPLSLTGASTGYSGIHVSWGMPGGTPLRGFQLATNWDGELGSPNGTYVRHKDDTQTAWGAWTRLAYTSDIPDTSSFVTQTQLAQASGVTDYYEASVSTYASGNVYKNLSGKTILSMITDTGTYGVGTTFRIGPTSPPTILVGGMGRGSGIPSGSGWSMTVVIPKDWYFQFIGRYTSWIEVELN